MIPLAQHLAEKLPRRVGSAFVRDHDVPWTDLTSPGDALTDLWDPILAPQPPPDAIWSANRWRWITG